MNLRDHCATKPIDLVPRLHKAASQKQGLGEDGFPATT
jgi:hypothetical protein